MSRYKELLYKLSSYPSYRPENMLEDETSIHWYDFLEIAEGDIEYALSLRERVEWQYPSTLIDEDLIGDEFSCKIIVKIEGDIFPELMGEFSYKEVQEGKLDDKLTELIKEDSTENDGLFILTKSLNGELSIDTIHLDRDEIILNQ